MLVYRGYRLNLEHRTIEVKDSEYKDLLLAEGYTVNPCNPDDDDLLFGGSFKNGNYVIRSGSYEELADESYAVFESELYAFKAAVYVKSLYCSQELLMMQFCDVLDIAEMTSTAESFYAYILATTGIYSFPVEYKG